MLKIYNQQAAALARVSKAAAVVTPGLFKGGMRGGASGVTKRGADGYVSAESRDVSRGVGGAPASSKVVSIPNFAFGGGKRGTMVANSSEYFVPNYAGGGDAIFNRDMIRSSGLPSGARKINAAAGFIPNFVKPSISIGKNPNVTTAAEAKKAGYSNSQISNAFGAQGVRAKGRAKKAADKSKKVINLNAREYSYLVPQFNFKSFERQSTPFAIKGSKKGTKYKLTNLAIRGPKIPGGVGAAGDPEDEFLENNIRKSLTDQSVKYGNILAKAVGGSGLSASNVVGDFRSGGTRGAFGALRGAVGSAFEIATTRALGIKQAAPGKNNADFDIVGRNEKLGKLFGAQGRKRIGDFKVSDSRDNKISFAKKIALNTGQFLRGASGYIPNFANASGLDDAIEREKAAGVPINQIRVNQSGKLRNSKNPDGIAVTNTRDEPTGRIPNFAKRNQPSAGAEGADSLSTSALGASTALFFLSSALSGAESGIGRFISEVALAGSMLSGLSLLKGPLESFGSKISGFGTEMATFRSSRTGGIMKGSEGKLKGAKGSLGRGISKFGGALPGIGTALAIGAVVAPLILEMTKTKTGFEELNKQLANIDLKGLQLGTPEAVRQFLNTLNSDIKNSTDAAVVATNIGAREGQTDEQRLNELLREIKGVPKALKDADGEQAAFLKSAISLLGFDATQGAIDSSRLTPNQAADKIIEGNRNQEGFGGSLNRFGEKIFGPADADAIANALQAQSDLGDNRELFDSDALKLAIQKLTEASEKSLSAAEKELAAGRKSGAFGEGAVTGGKARKEFTENLTAGRFAAGGFDGVTTGRQTPGGITKTGNNSFEMPAFEVKAGKTGGKTKILEKELALAKTISIERRVQLENEIALEKFAIKASAEKFKLTEDYVASIKEAEIFRADELLMVEQLVSEGKSLKQIQEALVELGGMKNVLDHESFQLALDKLNLKERELKAQEDEIENQNEINDLKKPQGFQEGMRQGLGEIRNDIAFFGDELGQNIPRQFCR